MICSSCGKHKQEVHPKKSRLMDGMTLLLCTECQKRRMEPRYIIVLYGRCNGFDSVAEYIRNRRYVGADIKADEFV